MQKTQDYSEKQMQKTFIPVKVCFRNVVKRFDVDTQTSYDDLQLKIGSIFKVPSQIKYQDDEFDMVIIENDVDLNEALKVIPNTGGILKLFLSEKPMSSETTWMNSLAKESPDNSFQVLQRPNSCVETTRKSPEECKKKKTHKMQKHRSKSPSNTCFSSDEEKDDHKTNRKVKKVDLLYKKMQQEMRPMMSEYRDEICAGIINSLEQHQQAMSNTVTKAILGRLEGAVIHSIHQSSPEKDTSNPPSPPLKMKSPTAVCGEKISSVTLETDDSEEDEEEEEERKQDEMPAPTPLSGCRTKYHHQNVLCDACEQEIFGPRYKCGNCPDYDLCERCESIEGIHHPSHVFLKLHYPCPRAGRGPAGGFLGPLMRTNIYEEWDNVREKEVLLQKILDSSSEAESVTLERIGKKEEDPLTAARIQRKAEWKRLKKEARKSKKQMCRKMKQMHHQVQQHCQEAIFKQTCEPFKPTEMPIFGVVDNELQIAMQKSYEENNPVEKDTEPVTSTPSAPMETSLIEIPVKPDVELPTSSHGDDVSMVVEPVESAAAVAADDVVKDTQFEQSVPEPIQIDISECTPNSISSLVEKEETSDENVTSPTSSEDFIVVAKCFDTSVPLDEEWIAANHSSCTEDHDAVNACSFIIPKDSLISLEEPPQVPATPSEPELVSVEPVVTPSEPEPVVTQSVNKPEPVQTVLEPTVNASQQNSVEHGGVTEPVAVNQVVNTPAPISVEPVIMAEPSSVVNREPTAMSNDWDSNIVRVSSTNGLDASLRTLSIEDIDPDHPDPKDPDQNGIRIRRIVAVNSQDDSQSIKRVVPVNIVNTQDNSQTSTGQPENQPDPVIQSQIDEYRDIQRKHHVNEQTPSSEEPKATPTQSSNSTQQNQPENQQNPQSEPMAWSNQFEGFVSQVADGVANYLGPYFNGSAPQYPPGAPHYPRTYAPTWVPPAPQQPPMAYFQNGNAQVITQGERSEAKLLTLTEMGFFDIERNRRVLSKYKGNVQAAISELLESTDNEWHQTRH